MPPKKKPKMMPEKPGRTRQYLMDHFNAIPSPDDLDLLKNGHVLFLFFENNKSVAETIRATQEKLQCKITPSHLKSLLNKSVFKLRDLSRESDMERFSIVCSQPYTLFQLPTYGPVIRDEQEASQPTLMTVPEVSDAVMSADDEPVPESTCPKETSSMGSKRYHFTPREMQLKRRLDFVSQTKSAMKQRYLSSVKLLRSQINSQTRATIKHLNQDINRKKLALAKKDAQIVSLKCEFTNSALAQELAVIRKKLKEMERKHKRLLKVRRDLPVTADSVPLSEYEELQDTLKIKEDKIRDLENKVMCLEDKIRDLENKVMCLDDKIRDLENKVMCLEDKIRDLENKVMCLDDKILTLKECSFEKEGKVLDIPCL